MKRILKKHKILFSVAVIVLIGISCFAIDLVGRVNAATAETTSQSALSESAGLVANATPSPQISPAGGTFSAETLKHLVREREVRRKYSIIPSLDCSTVNETDTWLKIIPENNDTLKAAALEKSAELAKVFFGHELRGDYIFTYYTDSEKFRKDFVQVATSDGAIICTLAADTLELINIDYALASGVLPVLESPVKPGSEPTADILKTADMIAAVFGTKVNTAKSSGISSGGEHEYEIVNYNVTMDNSTFVTFATLNGVLYAISVYPTDVCMKEGAYFEADIQWDTSVIHPASPRNFTEGEPDADDMTKEEARQMYLKFLNLANGTASYPDPTEMTFYIDHSGTRENYWNIKGAQLEMDIASRSKWLVSVTCSNLFHPEYDLTSVEFDNMGGLEYKIYVRNIMSNLFGDALLKVGPNARGDDHYCTYDAWMTDGTCYEFYFMDGKLTEVKYFFDDECRSYFGGWEADNTYINSSTGEEFCHD